MYKPSFFGTSYNILSIIHLFFFAMDPERTQRTQFGWDGSLQGPMRTQTHTHINMSNLL